MSDTEKEAVKTRKPRATKKAAESAPVDVSNVAIEEMDNNSTNEDGQVVIVGPLKPKPARKSNMHSKDETNTVSSHAADRALANKVFIEEKNKKDEDKKIALWSDKNIRWTSVGTLTKGYNIVSEEAAEKWLEKEGIRKATPQEVATYYSK